MTTSDRAGEAGERVGVPLFEGAARRAADDVHGAPDATADDEGGAQLVGDAGRKREVAVIRTVTTERPGTSCATGAWSR